MCMKPKIPSPPPPPPPPQAAKAPDNIDKKRRNVSAGGGFQVPGGTLLTGPSGAGAGSTGVSTLLGG